MENVEINIPKGWKEIALGDVLKYEQPYNYAVTDTVYNAKSGIPVLTAGKSFILGYTDETENVYTAFPVIIFDDFTTDTKFVDFPFKVKSSAMKFLKARNAEEINLKFFFEILQSLRMRGTFSDHKRRWISEYSKIKIHSPLYDEQTKIASILSKADVAIAQTEKLIAKYHRIKTGLMQDLLTKGIDVHGNIRNEKTHRFKTENGLRVPEEWRVVRLKECSRFLDNRRRPIKEGDRQNIQGDFPYYGASGIIDFINDYIFDEPLILLGEDGENILSRNLPLAFVAKGKYWVNNHAHVIQPNEDMNLYYLCMQLESEDYAALNTSSAQPKITKSKVEQIFVRKPKKDEQNIIADKLMRIENYIEQESIHLTKIQSLKTGLMQDLLSGKVRVPVLSGVEGKIKEEVTA